MQRYFKILIMIIVAVPTVGFCQKDSLALEYRVKMLEDYNERVLQQQFEAQKNQLSQQISIELDKAKLELSTEVSTFKIISYVVGATLALGIGYVIWQVVIGLKKRVERVMKVNLEKHLKENTGYLLDLITSQKIENTIRKLRKVFVASGSAQDLSRTVGLLKDMKFENVEGNVYNEYSKLPAADIYIFSSKDNTMSSDLINEFMKNGEQADCYIYYGTGRLVVDASASYAEQVNFANSRFTLYHQALTTLAFKDAIK